MKRMFAITAVALALTGLAAADAWAGAKMTFVGPKSLYAKVGLRTDDEVVNIDGKAPKTASEVGQLIYQLHGDGKTHSILVIRNGAHVDLTFK